MAIHLDNNPIKRTGVNVAFCCDDNFYLSFKTTLYSLFINHQDCFFNIYFFGSISSSNRVDLLNFVKVYSSNLFFVDFDYSFFAKYFDASSYYYNNLKRLLLPFYCKNVDYLLYLDSDLIIQKNIDDLLHLDIAGYAVALALDFNTDSFKLVESIRSTYRLDFYYNAGVLLYNCTFIREQYTLDDLVLFVEKNNNLPFFDQDIVNIFYKNHIFTLGKEYNYQIRHYDKSNNIIKSSRIIHYINIKPWQKHYPFFTRKSRFFWRYGKYIFGTKRKHLIRLAQCKQSILLLLKTTMVKLKKDLKYLARILNFFKKDI